MSFYLAPTATDALVKAGVSEDVIKLMSARQNGQGVLSVSNTVLNVPEHRAIDKHSDPTPSRIELSHVAVATSINSGDRFSTADTNSFLSVTNPPTGLFLSDVEQGFANFANAMNTQNPWMKQTSHSGFSVMLYEPKAWIGAKRAKAAKEFKTLSEADLHENDRLSVLRVIVHADKPEYLTALGNADADNSEHVVLRSLDKSVVVQPIAVEPTAEGVWNAFGARAAYAGSIAVFSMAELERIRSISPNREFFVTVVGKKIGSNRDFRIKPKHFFALGD